MREPPSRAIDDAPITSGSPFSLSFETVRGYGIAGALACVLAVSGAFETSELPLWMRFAYWVPVMMAGAVIGGLISWKLIAIERWARSPFLTWAVLSVLVAIPMTLVVWAITGMAFQGSLKLQRLPNFIVPVTLISAFMAGVISFTHQAPRETHARSDHADGPINTNSVRFLERLPMALRGATLYAVSSEDHYLRIHSSRGSDLILMRLSDAILELEGIEGAQVHRSWWVARNAITSVERSDGRATFTLPNGIQAPVSRTYAKALREMGWY
ncbi:LytTR family DNA-binding domain-containing protein [Candidatus Phycosocius spiralis]|uniref:HTH LytTR-type domain-containing protein n=1 Tax=Candidatus Phycosocius spiralis TaxID=2815099 RepID=A0ABQ4PXR6_9PROT|nr:LytTR family DNA-binding domain-containing protein [Candidatus Phycosocius spiralis]GIU67464.1 hypothetical protein PsB1_1618 [Candidatus Phycosocius spiralis]